MEPYQRDVHGAAASGLPDPNAGATTGQVFEMGGERSAFTINLRAFAHAIVPQAHQGTGLENLANDTLNVRTPKVAKTGYTDRGSHGKVLRPYASPLKKLTSSLNETYESVNRSLLPQQGSADESSVDSRPGVAYSPHRSGKKRVSPSDLASSPYYDHSTRRRYPSDGSSSGAATRNSSSSSSDDHIYKGFKSLEGDVLAEETPKVGSAGIADDRGGSLHMRSSSHSFQEKSTLMAQNRRSDRASRDAAAPAPAGLLHKALQRGMDGGGADFAGSATSSVSTIDGLSETGIPPSEATKKGECLTNPSTPDSNDGLDNVEGNLIVHVNDILRVPNKSIHRHKSKGRERRDSLTGSSQSRQLKDTVLREVGAGPLGANTDFKVLGLLGQGTFAQVFKCRDLATGKLVAVKIVKSKPAYTRQAAVEVDVFRALAEDGSLSQQRPSSGSRENDGGKKHTRAGSENMVDLICYFMYREHLCLVFELLGLNLYEVLKKRQFRGLPIRVVRDLVKQAVNGVNDISQRSVVHCDLKPENILLVDDETIESIVSAGEADQGKISKHQNGKKAASEGTDAGNPDIHAGASSLPDSQQRHIKLIDFGSACFEGQSAHTYIQSRFYRSPEVLVGLSYDSAIDMWSLGCVAAELFLGLPILPGLHEHDQLGRIIEMIDTIPDWMLDQGSKSNKYFVQLFREGPRTNSGLGVAGSNTEAGARPTWRLKTREEYISSLSEDERNKRGGLSKLEQQPTNRYFKRKRLADIVLLHGQYSSNEDKELLSLFVHFLQGILDPDPWKRWTAHQASMHPFLTGKTTHVRRGNLEVASAESGFEGMERRKQRDIYWTPPWDPSICRRKLLCVQKSREKQQAQALGNKTQATTSSSTRHYLGEIRRNEPGPPGGVSGEAIHRHGMPLLRTEHSSPEFSITGTSRVTAMTDAMSLQPLQSHPLLLQTPGINQQERTSPPSALGPDVGTVPSYQSQNFRTHGGASFPSQTQISGSLGTPHYNPSGGRMMEPIFQSHDGTNLPQIPGVSLVDGQYVSALNMVSGSEALGSGVADFPYGLQQIPVESQSFSGVYYDRVTSQNLPAEADLGYALQRPGVVPMGGDATVMRQQQQHQQQQPSFGTPLQQHGMAPSSRPTSLGRSGVGAPIQGNSFSGVVSRSNTAISPSVIAAGAYLPATSRGHPHLFQFSGQFFDSQNIGAGMNREASREALNMANASISSAPMAVTNPTSLLSQQLAEHSHNLAQVTPEELAAAAVQNSPAVAYTSNHNALSFDRGAPALHGQYYNYFSANGTPLMLSAPGNVDPRMTSYQSPHYLQQAGTGTHSYQEGVQLHPYGRQMHGSQLHHMTGASTAAQAAAYSQAEFAASDNSMQHANQPKMSSSQPQLPYHGRGG